MLDTVDNLPPKGPFFLSLLPFCEQLQLRGDVARGRAELAGEGRDDSTRVLELEQELVRGQGQGEAQGMRG